MSFKDDLKNIQKAQSRAKEMLNDTLRLADKFELYTSDVLQRLETIAKNRHFPFYFRRWLRAYYGVLDEILLTINGELHREYHLSGYDDWKHDRTGHSVKYAAGLKLASCSVDGIDYMYNRMSKQYGSSKKLEQISLPHDAFCDEVNTLSKHFIGLGREFVDNLAKVGYRVLDKNFEVRKEAFHIELTVNNETTICREDNRSLRKICDRDTALSMIIKDPPAIKLLLRSQTAKSSSRKAFDFDDDSDDENIDPFSAAMDIAEAAELTCFEMEAVSLDQIKQNYGASNELLAIPSERIDVEAELGNGYNNTDEMKVDYQGLDSHDQYDYYIQEDISWSSELPPRMQSSMKFKIMNPETDEVKSFVAIEIGMSAFDAIVADAAIAASVVIHIDDIRKELVRYLWMGFTPCNPSQPQNDSRRWHRGSFVPWLPSTIKIQNIRYSLAKDIYDSNMEEVSLPGREDLKKKRFPVDCDSSPAILKLMQSLQEWIIIQTNNPHGQLFRQQLLVANFQTIYHYSCYLKQLEDGGANVSLPYRAIIPNDDEDEHDDDDVLLDEVVIDEEEIMMQLQSLLLSQYEEFIQQVQTISTGPRMIWLRSWWMILQHFHRVDCSFSFLDTLQTVNVLSLPNTTSLRVEQLIWRNSPVTSYASIQSGEEYASWQEYLSQMDCWDKVTRKPFVESSFPWVRAIDSVLNALVQHKFRDRWADLCLKLFANAPYLRHLDLSHSWRPAAPLEVLVLIVGLMYGLKQVQHSISIDIQLNGLQAIYPGLDAALREYFVNVNGSIGCAIITFDTSGLRRSGLPL